MKYSTFVVAAAAGSAAASSSAYGQCGGNGWTGATDCVSGYHCAYQNDWYSQCVPGAGSGSTSAAAAAATTKVVTSAKASTTQAPSKAPVSTSAASTSKAVAATSGKVKVCLASFRTFESCANAFNSTLVSTLLASTSVWTPTVLPLARTSTLEPLARTR